MKYPIEEFEKLVSILTDLSKHFDVFKMNPVMLHYNCHQQTAENKKHNWLYKTESGLKPAYNLSESEKETATKVVTLKEELILYPDGCDDRHIETAVKNALKKIKP